MKTTLITVGGIIWRIINDPDIRILLNCSKLDFAKAVLNEIKNHFRYNHLFRACFPEFCPPENAKEWHTQDYFNVENRVAAVKEKTGMIGSFEAPCTGYHYDHIFNDDPHNELNVATMEQIQKVVNNWETQDPLFDGDSTLRTQVATIWHYADVNNHIMKLLAPGFYKALRDGNHVQSDDITADQYPGDVLKVYHLGVFNEQGVPIWPEKYSAEEIERKRQNMRSSFFANQYLNVPFAGEERDFKPEWFRYYTPKEFRTPGGVTKAVYDCGGKRIPADELTFRLTVDPAFGVKPHNDFTGIVCCGHWTDPVTRQMWLLVVDYIRAKLPVDEVIKVIDNMARKWHVREVGIESHGAQKLFTLHVRDKAAWIGAERIEVVPIQRGGEMFVGKARVRRLIPFYENGRIYHAPHMQDDDLERELMDFSGGTSKGVHDDLADALSDHCDFGMTAPPADFNPLKEALRPGRTPELDDDDWLLPEYDNRAWMRI